MINLIKLHYDYHSRKSLVCDDCLEKFSAEGICPKCGSEVKICPECYNQISEFVDHRCVFNSRQRQEKGITDQIWSATKAGDKYL